MATVRADKLLAQRGLATSRSLAQRLIEEGCVEAYEAGSWQPVKKTGARYDQLTEFRIAQNTATRYVSRAGLKLEGALLQAGLDVNAKTALDVGQSTGGFSDCLLQHGCASVLGIDVGRDQLAPTIRANPKVECMEGVNARELSQVLAPRQFDLVVMDVSFISQTLILPELVGVMANNATLISLVKPQFEVGPEGIAKGGIVKNSNLYADVEQKISILITSLGLQVQQYFESSIQGGDGNREFFVIATK